MMLWNGSRDSSGLVLGSGGIQTGYWSPSVRRYPHPVRDPRRATAGEFSTPADREEQQGAVRPGEPLRIGR